MSLYLLDTDMLSLFQHGHPIVSQAVADHANSVIAIAVLTVEEQLSGWYAELRRAKDAAKLAAIYERMADTVRFYSQLPIWSFTVPAIARYEGLKRLKLKIGKTDLRLSAISLERGAVLVTRNSRDFQRVPNLIIQDWSK